MHLAILDDREEVFVEYDAETFKQLLIIYSKDNNIGTAFDMVVRDLRNQVLKR